MISLAFQSLRLELPSPKSRDQETLDLRTRIKRSMNNTVWSFKSGDPIRRFFLDFGNLNRNTTLLILDFVRSTAGQTVIYTDYRGVSWNAKITVDPLTITHAKTRDSTVRLELEVV